MNAKIDISNTILHTARLILRPWNKNDLNDLYEYASVEGVGEMAGWCHHQSIEESKEILDLFIEGKSTFAVVLKDSNKVIGSIGIDQESVTHQASKKMYGRELGYVIGNEYWGKGLMTEAIREILKYVFLECGLDYVTVGHFIKNNRSRRVIEKHNFNYLCDYIYKTRYNTKEESKYYIMTKDEYLAKLEKIQLFTKEGEIVDKWVYRGSKEQSEYYKGVVDIVIKNTKYDVYLLTRRDRNKETYPNMLETTGGSISYGENIISAAKRELLEETGISDARLTFLYRYIAEEKKYIFFEFYAETECELDSIILQPGETSEYVWLDKDEYLNIWDSDLVIKKQRNRIFKTLEGIR